MIKRTKEVGCFASKFQLFTKEVAPNLSEHLYLTFDQATELFKYGKSIGQLVFFTPMYDCIDFLEELGIEYYKVRQKDNCNWKLLNKIVETKKIAFISEDNWSMRKILRPDNWIPLYCVSKYPASFEDYNNIITFGYSDHTPDFKLLRYALSNGALWFEKHCKLEGTTPLEDKWSVSFKELEEVLKKKKNKWHQPSDYTMYQMGFQSIKMIIKINHKEALKFLKRKIRRKIKKREKFMDKTPTFKKKWEDFVNEIDNIMAYGEEK